MKVNLSKVLYWISYTLLVISTLCIKVIVIEPYIKCFKYIAIILLIFKCFIQDKNYNKKTILSIIFLSIIGVITFFVSKDGTFIILLLLIFASKDILFDDIVKKDFYIKLILVLFMLVMYLSGLTSEYVIYRDNSERRSFGFSHPNVFGFIIVMIAIEYIFIHREKLKLVHLIPGILAIFIINIFSDSRSSTLLMIIIIIMCILDKINCSKIIYNKLVKQIIKNSFVIFTLISLVITFLFYKNTKIGIFFNEFFSGRISFILEFLQKYKINLFGNDLLLISTELSKITGKGFLILDNSFILILLHYGIIVYLIISYLFNKSFEFAYKQKDTLTICILFSLIIYATMESYLFKSVYNVFILYFSNVIYRRDEKVFSSWRKDNEQSKEKFYL